MTILETIAEKLKRADNPENIRFTIPEAEAYIPMPRGQLAQLRYTGKGPKFLNPTKRTVLYRKKDIDEWLNQSEQTSTTEVL